jgi:hypothetical protein
VQSVTATARGTEVEVERTGGRSRSYKDLDAEFRTGFQSTYGNTGADYESYAPAYRYGYDLATHKRYMQHDDWSALEAEAKPTWEQRNPGTWERYKDAIRQAWHRTRTSGQELKSGKPARSSKPA